MSKSLILVGAGGHAKVVADIAVRQGMSILGFLDDDSEKKSVMGWPVLGRIETWPLYADLALFHLAIGNNEIRRTLGDSMQVQWHTAIHPSAQIGSGAQIDAGCSVMANAVVNPGAVIGRHSIINTGAIVEHDDTIGQYTHISVGARLGGSVKIGSGCWIGIGAVVKNGISTCADCTIGAGAVVVKDIMGPGTYVGVPAKCIRR